MTKALIRLFIKNAEDTRSAAVREQYGILSGAVGLACNLFLFALKLTIGLVTGAISIAADAFNNLSDGLSCMISIVGFKVANREPDEKHPFGYGRTEYIAGLIVSFIILLVGFEFFKTSLDRIIHPSAVAFSALLTGILAVSMLVKLWMGLFNTTLGRRIDSPVLIAAGQDSRNDVITTLVVVLGMVAGRFTPLPVDGYVGILVAAFIIWSGIGIARDTVAPLLGEAADPVMAKNIEHIVLDSEHIVGVHDLIVHNYGAGRALPLCTPRYRVTAILSPYTRRSTRRRSASGSRPAFISSSIWTRSTSTTSTSTHCASRWTACCAASTKSSPCTISALWTASGRSI